MAIGSGGRVVVELDPEYKKRLYAELKRRGLTMREWIIGCAESDLNIKQHPTHDAHNSNPTQIKDQ